jgi:FKBP-type peptidyl-prolyl cis-trans isomerase SlyD
MIYSLPMNKLLVQSNNVVGFSYVLKDSEGVIIDQSETPLEYLHGSKNIIQGLEKALEGLQIGDKKEVVVSPEEGYGEVQEQLVHAFPRSDFPPDLGLEVGLELQADTPEGPMIFLVKEIREEDVLMDANHPLAGETLHFSVEIKTIREATEEEKDHGHVHGPGGHHH